MHLVREVILGHGEEAAVEVDEAGVGESGAMKGQTRDPVVAVELADGLGEHRPPKCAAPAGVAPSW
jgi:hypothetical protein